MSMQAWTAYKVQYAAQTCRELRIMPLAYK
jgi:hypothetical protein